MDAASRRDEIISILISRRHITVQELAIEFDVTRRTILSDIQALSRGFPIYTKPGVAGGVFIEQRYNPHINSLTLRELETLKEIYHTADEKHKETLLQILHKYGPDKLEV